MNVKTVVFWVVQSWARTPMLRSNTRLPWSGTKMEAASSSEMLIGLSTHRACPNVKNCNSNYVLPYKAEEVSTALTTRDLEIFNLGRYVASSLRRALGSNLCCVTEHAQWSSSWFASVCNKRKCNTAVSLHNNKYIVHPSPSCLLNLTPSNLHVSNRLIKQPWNQPIRSIVSHKIITVSLWKVCSAISSAWSFDRGQWPLKGQSPPDCCHNS